VAALVASLEFFRNGWLRLSPRGLAFSEGGAASGVAVNDYYFVRRSEEDWEYMERTGYKDRLFIIGAGHCGLAFSRIMRTMDFYITVFDHRPGLETLVRNEYVHEKVLVGDYEELAKWIGADAVHHYVVIMTQGYRTDDRAVRTLLPMDFRYLGLLGSKAKIAKMMTDYRAEGVDEERLRRVRAPAGFTIHSQTPEEIAISIAGEIIGVKNG
jgi:xanthine dehydrogenase accessory factor